MGNPTKTTTGWEGLDDAGRVLYPAKVLQEAFDFSTASHLRAITVAVETGCGEHVDSVVLSSMSEICGLMMFESAVTEAIEELEHFCGQQDSVTEPFDFGLVLAGKLKGKVRTLKFSLDKLAGFSDRGRTRFRKVVTEFLAATFARNFSFYSVKYDYIIKDGQV